MDLKIREGYCYQVINNLLDVTTPFTAGILMNLASSKGAVEVSQENAENRGFGELVKWSEPETDTLVLIDDNYLVCMPKSNLIIC